MIKYLRAHLARLAACALLVSVLSACGGTAASPTEVGKPAPTGTATVLSADPGTLPTPSATLPEATEVVPAPEPTATDVLPTPTVDLPPTVEIEPSPTVNDVMESPYFAGKPSIAPAEAQGIIEDQATKVVTALKNKDAEYLASVAHPDLGVTFSPYAYLADEDLTLTADELRDAFQDDTVRTWGSYDGTGEPINLTFAGYYERFIYTYDFAAAPSITYNEFKGQGTTVNNIFVVYPDGIAVEYHIPGIDPQFGGMDWESLYLVFRQVEGSGTWYLVHVAHGQWTI